MRLRERLRDGDEKDEGLPGREGRAVGDDVPQRRAVDQLHRQEDDVAVLALVVDADDVGVGQPRRRARLLDEAADEGVVLGEVGPHHLEGDGAVQAQVAGAVDGGHAPAGDLGLDPVATVDDAVEHGGGRGAHVTSIRTAPARPREAEALRGSS